jgi:hypothetical protein
MRKSVLSLILFLTVLSFLNAQTADTRVYGSVEEALKVPLSVTKFYLDCDAENDSLFFASIKRFPNLKSLTIVGYTGEEFPESLFKSGNMSRLCISECLNLNFNDFFFQMKSSRQLTALIIDDCSLSAVSPDISGVANLAQLIITNCENLNAEKSIENLAMCQSLRYLGLPVNQICELPSNIRLLNRLQMLDISNNILMDLPDEMSDMQSLEQLNVEGNTFNNPVESLARVGSLKIKYLSVDDGLTDAELARLKQLFPDAKIEGKKASGSSSSLMDSLNVAAVQQDSLSYGEFQQMTGDLIIYSEAYLHYPAIFGRLGYSFDSLLFDERYSSQDYYYVYKISQLQSIPASSFMLLKPWRRKDTYKENRNIAFNFYSKGQPYTSVWREMLAFNGMYWIYDGNLSRREFRKKYFKRSPKEIREGLGVTDLRLYYNDVTGIFTIEFKTTRGYETIDAHPILENANNPDDSKKQYAKRYTRYEKALDTQRKRFNKRLIRDKASNYKAYRKIVLSRWESFAKNYLSSIERKMSLQQWLQYYDKIVANEEPALEATTVTPGLLSRYLDLRGYTINRIGLDVIFDSAQITANANFYGSQSNLLAVQSIYEINTLQKVYRIYSGSMGVTSSSLGLGKSNNVVMLLVLRDGRYATVSQSAYIAGMSGSAYPYKFMATVYDAKLLSFGQLKAALGL